MKTKLNDTILVAMEIVLPILRSLKHEKECETKLSPGRHLAEYLAQIFTTDYSSAILHGSSKKHRVLVSFGMKTAEMRFSKTCVNFERCYGNQGWAEAVEK